MAKLPALIDAFVKVDGRDRATIENVARIIREAGYIPTTKRGSGASEMGVREAANLLIALNGADSPKEGPLAIDRFRSLRQFAVVGANKTPKWVSDQVFFGNLPSAIQMVAESRTFGEALEALIGDIPSLLLSFSKYSQDAYGQEQAAAILEGIVAGLIAGVHVELQRYSARIVLWRSVGSELIEDFEAKYIVDNDRFMSGFYGKSSPDRRVTVTCGLPTLFAIKLAILQDGPEIASDTAGGEPS